MREVKVETSVLLSKVKANREKHIREYKEACDGYRDAALLKIDEVTASLKRKIAELREGQVIALMGVSFGLDVPQDHSKDYDQAIAMIEMSVDTNIVIQSEEFAQYVMDDWAWRGAWEATKMRYTSRG